MRETIFSNARLVLADEIVEGDLLVRNGSIAAISRSSKAPKGAIDCAMDYLVPGLIELHTDHLEAHFKPRPKVFWPAETAVLAHDAQIAASGITTVFDALRVGSTNDDDDMVSKSSQQLAQAIGDAKSAGRLRVEHLLHLRCELACADTAEYAEAFLHNPDLRLISLMDHTPGQRQFIRMDKFKEYFGGKSGMSEPDMSAFIAERQDAHTRYAAVNRRRIVEMAQDRHVPLASHDDATVGHVQESADDGVTIAEFPTTMEAATASRTHGLSILMGAPNVVRGGSHSGNVSAQSLAECGLLDVLSSDYVPFSLLQAVFSLAERVPSFDLPAALRCVTLNPAKAAGLDDRGEIAIGKRADLVRVQANAGIPVVRSVWRDGARVI